VTEWSRERWRKLYLREPKDQEIWDWRARGLRDLLIRIAEDDGRIARDVAALRRLLRAGDELDEHVKTLLEDGFLVLENGALYVRNLPEAQSQTEPTSRGPRPTRATGSGAGRWANTTPEERSAAARRASEGRWGRRKGDASDDGPPDASSHMRSDASTDDDASSDASGDACSPRAVSGFVDPSESFPEEEKRQEKKREEPAREHASNVASINGSTDDASTHRRIDDFDGSPDETICPLDLVDRAERAGVFRHLAEHMPGVHVGQLRDAAREFVTYFSIGAGMGERRRHWMKRLRESLRRSQRDGRLRPLEAIEHEGRTGGGDERTRREHRRATEAMAAAYASAPEGTASDG
jgi:hypothetical protein